ncbi:MAG: hypothetical protein WBG90_04970 [Saonia sp.]
MKTKEYSILYLTDFYYPAKGRKYHEEDIYIIGQLRDTFKILICHPLHSKDFESLVDIVAFRNTGSVIYYKDYYQNFLGRITDMNIPVYNAMTGKGDMRGKQYLLDLTDENYPVIPTIESLDNIEKLQVSETYILKPKNGADSIGMKRISHDDLQNSNLEGYIIQPYLDFKYEVSFYFVDSDFQYALYAPDKRKRWTLKEYIPSTEDLKFAHKFIAWNSIAHGIQRVDACRLEGGELLLVELEDLNPYLSLNALSNEVRQKFISAFKSSLMRQLDSKF